MVTSWLRDWKKLGIVKREENVRSKTLTAAPD